VAPLLLVIWMQPVMAQEAETPEEDAGVDTSVRWNTDPGDLYNGRLAYGDADVTSWNGRYIYGPTVGIVQLPANIPMLPGDMGNSTMRTPYSGWRL
jgi:hypothetical protein